MTEENQDEIKAQQIMKDLEAEEQAEQDAFSKAQQQIAKQNELDGYFENPGQQFGSDGMMEPTVERTNLILDGLIKTLKSSDIVTASIERKLVSKSEQDKATLMPFIIFAGEQVTINFIVPPTDKYGNWGKRYITQKEAEAWNVSKTQ